MRNTYLTHCFILAKRLGFIFLIIASGNAKAQSPDGIINHFFTLYPNEQVYLQLDNNYYFPGDTVWFKAYVTDNGVPSLLTKSLYVDWFDDYGLRITHQALQVVNGMATAQYALPPSLTGKKAHVIAYTRWMLNDSCNFVFHKDLTLIEETNSKPKKTSPNSIAPIPELRFFPEGGSLVTDLINKVAFKAVREDGSPGEVKGVIRDNAGHPVANFSSNHKGMGYFYLIPASGSAYTAEWSDAGGNGISGNGIISRTPLPVARPTGMSMDVLAAPKERTVILRRSAGLSGRYYLLGTVYGAVTYLAKVNLEIMDTALCHVPIDGYPDGMLTLTVLDSAWTPVSERILFIRGQDNAAPKGRIDLSIEQKGLSARGQNKILIHYTGAGAANLSITASDAALPDDNLTDMAGYLSLSGQLKSSSLLYAKQFFYDSSANATEDLDLLALTGEWKHNDWKAILTRQEEHNTYAADTSYYFLSGKAVKPTGKKDQLAFLIKKRDHIAIDTLELTANGSVCDSSLILFDTTWVLYRPKPKQKHYSFLFDQLFSPAWDKYPFPDEPEKYLADQKQGARSIAPSIAPDNSPSASSTADLSKRFGKTLQAATVTAAKRPTRMDSLENLYESDMVKSNRGYPLDLHGAVPNTNFSFFLHNLMAQVPDFPDRVRKDSLPLPRYIYLVDENPIPYQALMEGAFPQIVFVKYFSMGLEGYGVLPVIAMYTEKYDFDAKMNPAAADPDEYIVKGYTGSRPYDTLTWQPGASSTQVTDLRRTLYWNPSVPMDAENNSVLLNFANNDHGGPIRIVIEGMDEDGNPIHLERIISD